MLLDGVGPIRFSGGLVRFAMAVDGLGLISLPWRTGGGLRWWRTGGGLIRFTVVADGRWTDPRHGGGDGRLIRFAVVKGQGSIRSAVAARSTGFAVADERALSVAGRR